MSSTLQALMNAAAVLPANERAELAQYLLGTFDAPDEEGARADWLALAEQRMAAVRSDQIVGSEADEVLKILLAPGR